MSGEKIYITLFFLKSRFFFIDFLTISLKNIYGYLPTKDKELIQENIKRKKYLTTVNYVKYIGTS